MPIINVSIETESTYIMHLLRLAPSSLVRLLESRQLQGYAENSFSQDIFVFIVFSDQPSSKELRATYAVPFLLLTFISTTIL